MTLIRHSWKRSFGSTGLNASPNSLAACCSSVSAGLVALILAIALPIAGTTSALPLIGTALIAGIIAIAASIQHRRYQPHP